MSGNDMFHAFSDDLPSRAEKGRLSAQRTRPNIWDIFSGHHKHMQIKYGGLKFSISILINFLEFNVFITS